MFITALMLSACTHNMTAVRDGAKGVAPRPNVILILTDDQGYGDLGAYGATDLRTPNIDRLAAEGIRFTDFYAQPICGPARAALLTGSYPIRIAEPGNTKSPNTVIHSKELTIAEVLQGAGYATAAIGKWHLAGDGDEPWDFAPPPLPPGRPGGKGPFKPELMPNAQGFDYFFGTPMHNGYTREVDHRRFIVDLMRNAEIVETRANVNLLTQLFTQETIQFIRSQANKPFFIYLAHNMPHVPLGASDAFRGKSSRGLYGDAIEELDWSVGQILDELERLELDNDTLVIFASDNGPELRETHGDHVGSAQPLSGKKYSNWEGGVRVPAVMRWPGKIPGGTVTGEVASLMDIYPTVAQLAGANLPAELTIDGEDISTLMFEGRRTGPRQRAHFYYALTKLQAARKGRWKLVLPRVADSPHMLWLGRYMDTVEKPMLFNLRADIAEQNDLADARPEVVADLMREVEWARSELGDYNRIGSGARFFDQGPPRPNTYFPKDDNPTNVDEVARNP